MADEPKRLTLNSQHWQILALGNSGVAARLMQETIQYLQSIQFPTDEHVAALDNQWQQIASNWAFVRQHVLRGWQIAAKNEGLSAPPPAPQTQPGYETPNPPRMDGPAAMVHALNVQHQEITQAKTSGWPKGKKRGPRKPKPVPSSAAVLPPVTQ